MKQKWLNVGRAFSAGVMTKALKAFDRATMVVVITVWSGSLVILAFALYAVNLSVIAKRETLTAAATEPSLPRIVSKDLESAELQPLVDRLKKQFPEVTFAMIQGRALTISAKEIDNFRLWLTVINYIDTITPQYRWTIKEFCVGSACGGSPMSAILTAEKITFSAQGNTTGNTK